MKAQGESAQSAERNGWLGQRDTVPHLAPTMAYAFKPARLLSVVDTGIEPFGLWRSFSPQ
jgi:hypothetical protein